MRYFGVTEDQIKGKRHFAKCSDARSAFIYAIYSNDLMDGVEIARYLGYTSRASYYHIRKYRELKNNKVFEVIMNNFEQEIKNEIEKWRITTF